MYVIIGDLRHRMTLEAVARTSDGGGGATEAWDPVATLWASLEPLAGNETFTAERLAGHITHAIQIRYRSGVTPAMRFRLGTRIFEITAVIDPDERRRLLRCLCRERDL